MTDYATLLRDHVTLNVRAIDRVLIVDPTSSDLLISTGNFRSLMKTE